MDGVMDFLRGMGPWSPIIVFLSATAESAGFIGLFVPGELLTIVGGAIAGLGDTPLAAVMLAAVLGAITGDSIGYWIGSHYGVRVLDHPRLRRVRPAFEKAGDFLDRHGKWALVLARFTPMVRSLVPMAAGATRMRYRTFVIGNAAGGVAWGVTVSAVGYWAGRRWETIEQTFRQGMLLFVATVAVIGLAAAGLRWVANNPRTVRRRIAKLGDRPVVGRVLRMAFSSWGEPRPFMRLAPHVTLAAAFLTVIIVTSFIDLSYPESKVLSWIDAQISSELRSGLTAASRIMSLPTLAALSLGVVGISARRHRNVMGLIAASTIAASLVAAATSLLVDREVGPVPMNWAIVGDTFPDVRVALGTALALSAAWPWQASWAAGTRRLGLGLALAFSLATIAVGSASTYPVDAAAGLSVGFVAVVVAAGWLDPRIREAMRFDARSPAPSPVGPSSVPAAQSPSM